MRSSLTLAIAALFSFVVGAQSSNGLTSKQKGDLFVKNRPMIEQLVRKTVESSKVPQNALSRAETYYDLLVELNSEIRKARIANDDHRVRELTAHLNTLLDSGLTPMLVKAKVQIEGGTGVEEFEKVKAELLQQLNALVDELNDRPDAKQSLSAAKDRLQDISMPGKK